MNGDVRYVSANDVSTAWFELVSRMVAAKCRVTTNVAVRIDDPSQERSAIRAPAERLLSNHSLDSLDTVRNTIFPVALATDLPEPDELASRYMDLYPWLRRHGSNRYGTYFGRMVAYPRADGEASNQLSGLVSKLRHQLKTGKPMSSLYELNVYNERKDANQIRGFPCLSHCAFHLHEGKLDCNATYRNQLLIQRAYGNYLGLAALQSYVAALASVEPGELFVVAGHLELDRSVPYQSLFSLLSAVAEPQAGELKVALSR